jgi:hypothetical protein
MLPGFRILFATTVLAISILVFGLGAAALLRAAHEEFASLPSWRLAQQPLLTPWTPQVPRLETTPVLAMLRIEAPGTKPLPETLRREVILPEPAPQQPVASQVALTDDARPAEAATQDSGSAVKDADEATASAPVNEQVAALNVQSIDAPASPEAQVQEANAPDVKTPDVKESRVVEAAITMPAESKTTELKPIDITLAQPKPSPTEPPNLSRRSHRSNVHRRPRPPPSSRIRSRKRPGVRTPVPLHSGVRSRAPAPKPARRPSNCGSSSKVHSRCSAAKIAWLSWVRSERAA